MAKAKIGLPPKPNAEPAAPVKADSKATEKKIQEVINKGGTTLKSQPSEEADSLKNFNIRILGSELTTINQLREKRPKTRSQKKASISLHDWIIEAIQEKIERENKKYNQV